MTLAADACRAVARDLFEAERTRSQIGLLSRRFPEIGMEDAYEIQTHLVALKRSAGLRVTGWKIGLTSQAMQDALNIDIPDSGVLFDNMHFPTGASVPSGRFIQPRIEAEIAFVMKRDLDCSGRRPDREEVLAATEYTTAALEILDTRILRKDPETQAMRTVFDTIADNAANAGVVLGKERHAPGIHDLRWVGSIVSRNGQVEETGLGAGVLGDPAVSIGWLAERLASCGQAIRGGQVVLSGSFIRPIEARPGDRFDADFGDFGSVEVSFAKGR